MIPKRALNQREDVRSFIHLACKFLYRIRKKSESVKSAVLKIRGAWFGLRLLASGCPNLSILRTGRPFPAENVIGVLPYPKSNTPDEPLKYLLSTNWKVVVDGTPTTRTVTPLKVRLFTLVLHVFCVPPLVTVTSSPKITSSPISKP